MAKEEVYIRHCRQAKCCFGAVAGVLPVQRSCSSMISWVVKAAEQAAGEREALQRA